MPAPVQKRERHPQPHRSAMRHVTCARGPFSLGLQQKAGIMHRDRNKVVVLTGASAGLGLAITRELLATSHRLVLTAKADSMGRFAAAGIVESDRVLLRPLDVVRDNERSAVIDETLRTWGGVDVLINNAGIAYRAVVEHVTPEAREEIFDINYRGPMELTRLVLPGMRARRRGLIMNISSVAGMVAMPTMSLYSASKFALEGASEALWYEMRPFGVHVTLMQPGFIRSASFRNTRYTAPSERGLADAQDPYHRHYEQMDKLIARLMRLSPNDTAHVARKVVRLLDQRDPPLRVSGTLDAHVFGLIRRFLPRGFYHRFLYARLPDIRHWGRPADGPEA